MPARPSSASSSPISRSDPRRSYQVLPAATMPSQASLPGATMRFSPLARANASTASCRSSNTSRSCATDQGATKLLSCRCCQRRPFSRKSGLISSRSFPSSTVLNSSATSDTIFMPTHKPQYRDKAKPNMPRSRISWALPGYSTGIMASNSAISECEGMVDDLQDGSSPASASTPP